jgi:hypothetical protein
MPITDPLTGHSLRAFDTEGWQEGLDRLRAAMAGEAPLDGLDETLVHDGAHWTAEGPRGALWVIRWSSAVSNVTAWKFPRGRTGFRAAAADLPAARREAARIAALIADGKTRED